MGRFDLTALSSSSLISVHSIWTYHGVMSLSYVQLSTAVHPLVLVIPSFQAYHHWLVTNSQLDVINLPWLPSTVVPSFFIMVFIFQEKMRPLPTLLMLVFGYLCNNFIPYPSGLKIFMVFTLVTIHFLFALPFRH